MSADSAVEPVDDDRPEPARGLGRVRVGALAGFRDHDVDDAELVLLGGGHPHRAAAAVCASSAVRHRIEAQPSGLITE